MWKEVESWGSFCCMNPMTMFSFCLILEPRESWSWNSKLHIRTDKWISKLSSSTNYARCGSGGNGSFVGTPSSREDRSVESRGPNQHFLGCQVSETIRGMKTKVFSSFDEYVMYVSLQLPSFVLNISKTHSASNYELYWYFEMAEGNTCMPQCFPHKT